jgi:aldehyde dehydrogenase family 9 protein A1
LARTEVLDTGKPIYEARMDIAGCADTIDYYGGLAASISGMLENDRLIGV